MFVGVRLPAVIAARGKRGGVSRGVQSRWLIGAFLALASVVREENALMSYGFLSPKSLRWCRR